jgi:hypothetical protein
VVRGKKQKLISVGSSTEITFQRSKKVVKTKDGKGQRKDKGVFLRSRDNKGTQRIFLQRRGGADHRHSGFTMRVTEYQSNPSMGVKPTGKRVSVETFSDKKHSLLLLAYMLVKADKARFAEFVFHTMGTIANSRWMQGFHAFIRRENSLFDREDGQVCQSATHNKRALGGTGDNHRSKNGGREE